MKERNHLLAHRICLLVSCAAVLLIRFCLQLWRFFGWSPTFCISLVPCKLSEYLIFVSLFISSFLFVLYFSFTTSWSRHFFCKRNTPFFHFFLSFTCKDRIWYVSNESPNHMYLVFAQCFCHGGQLPSWSSGYDARLECERPGFDPPLRHWIFRSIRTHCCIWWPIVGFMDLFIWSEHEDMLSPEGGECHRGQLPWWSIGYDTRLECERPGFDSPLKHWIFWSVRTHCYIS